MSPDFRNFEEDVRSHLEEEVAENIARGMSPVEARYAALRKFGNVLQVQENTRAVWIPVWADQLLQDCRYALRSHSKNRLFSAVVLLTIALGIGVNTSVFSVLNTILLRPLPYPDSARLVVYTEGISGDKAERFKTGVVGADYAEWRSRARSFQHLAGYQYQDSTLATFNGAIRVRLVSTAGDFWVLTGAQPALGRFFTENDRGDVMIISHRVFVRQFGGNREILGKTAMLGGRQVAVIGVLGADFRFLFPQDRPGSSWQDVDVFVPAPPLLRGERNRLFVVGKLNVAATLNSALTEIKAIQAANLRSYPDRWFAGVERMSLERLQKRLAGPAGRAIVILQVAGIFVLLVACANIANLLLARTAARQREVSIRIALGAGRGRMLRQFFAEGLVLSASGALAGLLLAKGLIWGMAQWAVKAMPRLSEVEMDARVMAFTIGVSLASAMLFCFGPAATLLQSDPQMALKDRSGDGVGWFKRLRIQRCLVAGELALAVILLAGAGLMVKSFLILHASVPGFEPEHTLVLQLSLTKPQYKERAHLTTLASEITEQIESLPGVQAAAICETQGYLLQTANSAVPAIIDQFQESLVSPGYFAAMGMRLIAGRWLESGDPADAAVINETMARRVFGDRDPLGQDIGKLGRPVRVVGVVANLKYSKLDAEPGPEVFRGYRHNLSGLPTLSVVARVQGDPLLIAAEARRRIAAIEPQESIHDVQTLEDVLSDSIAPRRFNLMLLTFFACAALLMAGVGIYGVMSYSVTQRTREIGVRLALGAKPWGIAGMLIQQGMTLAAAGILAGLAAAYVLTRWMSSLLYAVQPNDPAIYASVTAFLASIAFIACLLPAIRAAHVNPLTSLRHD